MGQDELRAMAKALAYACDWAGDPAVVEGSEDYARGARETVGHLLACVLCQQCGWGACPTDEARDKIPWQNLPWSEETWYGFLVAHRKAGSADLAPPLRESASQLAETLAELIEGGNIDTDNEAPVLWSLIEQVRASLHGGGQ